jgi:asparagine synthase (glutamine-hydrolysing)
MCGIFGHFHPNGADANVIERMARRLAHRGPDGCGTVDCGTLAFGAVRLAIIDLQAGFQPIFSEDRRTSVVFNGEIYNHKALRAELERLGHRFATRTDTEVIVHGYEAWGDGVLDRLRGMFALCIWDGAHERLLLARDRTGEKPLYYATLADGGLVFASEIKALFEHRGLTPKVNHAALPHFLILGYVPPPETLFAGVYKLAPGERLIVERGKLDKAFYWQARISAVDPPPYAEAVEQVRAAVTEAVEIEMMSDVPIGAFLSGGVDSTIVVSLMQSLSAQPVQTFTVGFDMPPGSKNDRKFNVDVRYAALVAQRLGTRHHTITIRQDEHLSALLPHLVYAMDEPISIPTMIQTVYVSALARRCGVPVMLGGDAGDELFLGYSHYRMDRLLERYLSIPALVRRSFLTPLLEHLPSARFENLRKLARKSRLTDPADRYLTWTRIIDGERLPDLLIGSSGGVEAVRAALRPLLTMPQTRHFAQRAAYAELRLPMAENINMRVDKMSMAMSVEARSPLQDYKLVELALQLPLAYKLRRGGFKTILKDAFADRVPAEVLARPKWGFTPPASEWLRTGLRPLVEKVLSPERVAAVGVFRPETISRLIRAHITERRYELWSIWSALIFHIWHALYIDRSLALDHALSPDDLVGADAG